MTHMVTRSILEMDQTVLGAGAVSAGTIPAQKEWLLAYARVLQHVAEVSRGHEWVNTYPRPVVCTADLVKAFMMVMEVQHELRDIARCWGEPPDSCPAQPRIQEFAQVTALLDSMAAWVPSQRAFDKLVYPPYEPRNHHSCCYVVGVSWIWKSPCPRSRWQCMIMTTYSPEGMVFCSKAESWSMTHRTTVPNGCDLGGLPLTYQMRR